MYVTIQCVQWTETRALGPAPPQAVPVTLGGLIILTELQLPYLHHEIITVLTSGGYSGQ